MSNRKDSGNAKITKSSPLDSLMNEVIEFSKRKRQSSKKGNPLHFDWNPNLNEIDSDYFIALKLCLKNVNQSIILKHLAIHFNHPEVAQQVIVDTMTGKHDEGSSLFLLIISIENEIIDLFQKEFNRQGCPAPIVQQFLMKWFLLPEGIETKK